MNAKLQTRAFEQLAPAFFPGEQPLVATRALVGTFDSSRFGAAIKQGLAAGGGGMMGAALAATPSRKQFVVLTSHRMIFLTQTFLGGPGRQNLGEVPRGQFALAEVKLGTVSLIRVAFGVPGDGVALTFPLVDKKNAEALAAALQQQAPIR